ncbi:MAG: thioredoxin family protein [Muribaculaceae bacterium]|nr:thioredoxin family protein [Muribaculaceae bacterium]
MKLQTILILGAAAVMARPGFHESVERIRHAVSASQADSIAASLLTSAADIADVGAMARDSLFTIDSPMHDEAAYAAFARAIIDSPHATTYQRSLAEWELSAIELNAPGSEAADFEVKPLHGSATTMRSMTAGKPHFLYFYNPDCRHCAEVMRSLRSVELPAPVLAVCVETTESRWRQTAGNLPQGWIPALDLTDVQDSELYIFLSTPAIYLLSADGRVLAKNLSVDEIKRIEIPE